jgi:hypothetical protein
LEAIVPPSPGERFAKALARATEDKKWQMRILAVLIPHLPEERLLATLPSLLKMIGALKTEADRAWVLTKLAFNVPEELLCATLEVGCWWP